MNKQPVATAAVLIALCAFWTGAAAQPAGQGQRDAKMADEMEKARLKAEAQPVQAYIPPPKPEEKTTPALKKPEVFVAKVPPKPGDKPAKKPKKKSKPKKQAA